MAARPVDGMCSLFCMAGGGARMIHSIARSRHLIPASRHRASIGTELRRLRNRSRCYRANFHQRAAEETLAVLDALETRARLVLGTQRRRRDCLESCADGARSSGSDRCGGDPLLPAEAPIARVLRVHARPARTISVAASRKALEVDHGSRWRALLTINGEAWLCLADSAGDGGRISTTDGWRTFDASSAGPWRGGPEDRAW